MNLAKYANDVRSFPGDAIRAWRAGGWPAVKQEIARRTVGRVGGYVRRFVIEADLLGLIDPGVPAEVDIRPFEGPDWSLLGDLGRSRLTRKFAEASAAGRICLVAWKRRRAVGYAWFSPVIETRHENYDISLPGDAIYVWQVEVARGERRRGVGAALVSRGLELCRSRGYRRSWMIIQPDNIASIRTIASVAPSRVQGTVARLKVFSWMRSWYRALQVPVPIVLAAPTSNPAIGG